jgi:phosphoglycolate phosphatase
MTGKAILFDFDGTLVPNLDLADMRRQIAAMAKAAGVPDEIYDGLYIVEIIEASQAWLSAQIPPWRIRHRPMQRLAISESTTSKWRLPAIPVPFEGVRQVLGQLRDAGYRLGIVTRNCRAAVLTMFPDMDDFIDCLHARDDVDAPQTGSKTSTDNLDALGVGASAAVMVGDGALDMQAGRALNMRCVGVLTGSNNRQALTEAGATDVLADYRGLVTLLI